MHNFKSIDIVVADRGWILESIARRIKEHAPKELRVRIVDKPPSDHADVTLFMPYSAFVPVPGFTVGFFTHQELVEPAQSRFVEVAHHCDLALCMSEKYAELLRAEGVGHAVDVGFAVDLTRFAPILRVGVVGRAYSRTKRKGEDLLASLQVPEGVELVFSGEGWHRPSRRVDDSEMAAFYSSLDYLLVPSRIEGGPAPLLEALACGIEVIAPTEVGFVRDYPHVSYELGSAASLQATLETLYQKKAALRSSVADMGWDSFAERLLSRIAENYHSMAVEQVEENRPPSVLIGSHGSEATSKGGPSTRIKLIAGVAEAECSSSLAVDTTHNPSDSGLLEHSQLLHLFNSWPLVTAERELAAAKRAGVTTLYSPIALNLECLPTYTDSVEHILKTSDRVNEDLLALRTDCPSAEDYRRLQGLIPSEGYPGHFDALRRTTEAADHIVVLSDYERDFLERIGCKTAEKTTLVVNGVDAEHFIGASPELFSERFGLKDFVLVTGRIERRKNQALLARAVASLPDCTLVLIGAVADEEYFHLVRSQIDAERLIHINRIEGRELLASAYAASAVYVNCAFCEGASLASIEAFHAGAKLVLSDQSSEREYFGSAAEYAHPLDVEGMTRALAKVLAEPRVEDGGGYLRRDVDSGQAHAKATLALYQQFVASSKPSLERPAALDITHWAHSLHNGVHPTGVTRLEEEAFLSGELQGVAFEKYVVWNSPRSRFIEVSRDEVLNGLHAQIANSRRLPGESRPKPDIVPRREVHAKPSVVQPSNDLGSLYRRYLTERKTHSVRQLIQQMRDREGTAAAAVYAVKTLLAECVRLVFRPSSVAGDVDDTSAKAVALPTPSPGIDKADAQISQSQSQPDIGSLVVIGQPWISNDRYIESLTSLVNGGGVDLGFYVHDLTFVTHPRSHQPEAKVVYRTRLKRMLSLANRVFVNGDSVCLDVRRYCAGLGIKVSLDVLPYDAFRSQASAKMRGVSEKAIASASSSEPLILMVGTLNERKGHGFLLDVWEYLTECRANQGFRLCIVGKPMGASTLKDRVVRAKGVHYIDNADDQMLRVLYKSSAFTVYPSEAEGWGLPIEESVSFGKQCLASNRCPAAQQIDSSLIELLEPDDFFGWADRIGYHIKRWREDQA